MANTAHPGVPGFSLEGERSTRHDRWVPWVLAMLVLLSGFGLGAVYVSVLGPNEATNADAAPAPNREAASAPAPTAVAAPEPTATTSDSENVSQGELLGPTEVAFVTNFPLLEFEWETFTVPTDGRVDLRWIGTIGEGLGVVGVDWSGSTEAVITWTSPDGRTWTEAGTLQLPEGSSIQQIVGTDDRIFVFGENWSSVPSSNPMAYVTSDGADWSLLELPMSGREFDYVYVQGVIANDLGTLVVLSVDSYPDEPPQVLDFGEFIVEIDHRSGRYTLSDPAGTVVLAGSTDDIWRWNDSGQAIYEVDSGELITIVPWEEWEMGWAGAYEGGPSSPLPIPIETPGEYSEPVFEITWDGFVIRMDEGQGNFEVREEASGELVTSGPIDFLWRGPAPTFVDAESGEVILAVSWEAWDKAEMESWEAQEQYPYNEYDYTSETVALFSPDGITWEDVTIASGPVGSSTAVAATADAFVLNVTSYGEYGERRAVWTSDDGIRWESTEPAYEGDRYLHHTIATETGLLALGDGPGGQGVWSSPDGLRWNTEFTVGPQDDGGYLWLSAVAAGPMGTAVAGTTEGAFEYLPLVISSGDLTAEFEGDFIVRITDEATGEELLLLTWEDYESGLFADRVDYREGATSFFDAEGSVIMTITDETAREAMRLREADRQSQVRQVLFLETEGRWFEIGVESKSVGYVAGLIVGESEIVLGGVVWDESPYGTEEGYDAETSVVVLVGKPAGR